MIQIIILYALFASTFSLGKVLLEYVPPIFLVGIRMTIAGIVLLLFQYMHRDMVFRFERKHWWLYTQIVLCTVYFPYILRFYGLQYPSMTSSKAALIYNLSPFMSYILAYFLTDEKITVKKGIGLLIGFLGLLPVLIGASSYESFGVISWAEISMVLSISFLSYGWIIVRKLVKDKKYPSAMVNGISMFFGGVLALLTSLFFEGCPCIVDIKTFTVLLAIVIIVSNLICHNLYANLLKKYTPTFLSFASFLTPLFAALYGWVFLSEPISVSFILSALGVFIGLVIFYQDELKEHV